MCQLNRLMLLLIIWCLTFCCALSAIPDSGNIHNDLPIIGVLTEEIYRDGLIARTYPDKEYVSYIAASYVKFVEGAGGRVVPLWIGQPRSYYEDIMSKINGVLLPGGSVWFNNTAGYSEAGEHIIRIAQELNDAGTYMPIWGTCLGMELLVYVLANHSEARTDCNSKAQALPLIFKQDFQSSRLFASASNDLIDIWRNKPVTVNWHMFCYTEEGITNVIMNGIFQLFQTFAAMKLNNIWRVMSLNHDWYGIEFISSIEHKNYPFYGVQFHPEKNLYEFVARRNITHTTAATLSSQYFADFFIGETRKNTQRFRTVSEEMSKLIFNYKPEFTGAVGSSFIQQYLFEPWQMSDKGQYHSGRENGVSSLLSSASIFSLIMCFLHFM